MIQFTVYGIPVPKGSMRAFMAKGARFPVITEDNKSTRPWAALVKDAAIQSGAVPTTEAVCLNVMFHMPRPKSLPKKVAYHTKKPDLDKLLRAVKDALTGIIWRDDAQVVNVTATKLYVANGGMPRAEIEVMKVGEIDERTGIFAPGEYPLVEERSLF